MSNQLAKSKRRQSLAEHEAVLAALKTIAEREETTVMELLRRGARELVARHTQNPDEAETLRRTVLAFTPQVPSKFESAAQVARFKREQRAFDQVLQDLHLATPQEIQARNSLVRGKKKQQLLDFERSHASL